MAKVKVINLKGENVKELTINDSIWKIEINDIVLKKSIKLGLASLRQGTHKTKNRSEVSGGGRKPYRQKGTGRARQGTIRAPQYRGGGIVFGVSPRDYSFKMNKKERVLALKGALAEKYNTKSLVVIDELKLDSLKTKDAMAIIKNLKLGKKVLFVTKEDNENLYMATRNILGINVLLASEINVLDLTYADTLVCDEAAIESIEEVLK